MNANTNKGGGGMVAGGAIAAVAGILLLVVGLLAFGLNGDRNSSGYVPGDGDRYSTSTYAITTKAVELGSLVHGGVPPSLLGRIRVDVESRRPTFVGIARADDVKRYLGGVAHRTVDAFEDGSKSTHGGAAPSSPPDSQRFWVASHSGRGAQLLEWKPRSGDWRVVVMNADAGPDVSAHVSVAAKLPRLVTVGIVGTLLGAALLGGSVLLIKVGTRREKAVMA